MPKKRKYVIITTAKTVVEAEDLSEAFEIAHADIEIGKRFVVSGSGALAKRTPKWWKGR